MHVWTLEKLAQICCERRKWLRTPLDSHPGLTDEAVPHAAAAPFVGVPHLFGMQETIAMLQEQPERPCVRPRQSIQDSVIRKDGVQGGLSAFVAQRGDAIGV